MSIVVLGIGNVLRGDDGFGVHVARELLIRSLPQGVKVIMGELRPLAYLEDIEAADHLIIVDALDAGRPAGSAIKLTFTPSRLGNISPNDSISPHGAGAFDLLKLLTRLGASPHVTVIGCQCGSATEGANLSPEVQRAVPEAVAASEREIRRLTSPT